MQEGLPNFFMSCSYRLRPVRAECDYDAKGALFHLGATLLAFWVIESVVLAVFQLCALKLGLSRTLKVRVECDTALVNLPSGVDAQ